MICEICFTFVYKNIPLLYGANTPKIGNKTQ